MKIRSVILGTVVFSVVTALVFFAVAVVSYFTDITASLTNILFYIGTALGVFLGAVSAARNSGTKVLFNSLAVSVMCILILVAVSFAVNGKVKMDMHFLTVSLASLLSGFLGAVAGK